MPRLLFQDTYTRGEPIGAMVQGFEEVSLGYPRQWDADRGMTLYLRQIWPEV